MDEHASVRDDMTDFWKSHSSQGTLEEMMLDSKASVLSQYELPEIMSLLPGVRGKKILELGAGIGRFTGLLADSCSHITAVDFMPSFVKKNRENNGHKTNIDFVQADVMALELPLNSFDIIFTNWLFMYLSDEELTKVASRMVGWLKEGGHLFFRESCFHQSGDKKRNFNPTQYRTPHLYNAIFQNVSAPLSEHECDQMAGFELISCRSVKCYVKLKNNPNQYCWLWQKLRRDKASNHGFDSFQQFLDSKQYSRNNIQQYEKIFGEGYISTGGHETTEEFVAMLGLVDGQVVLDVGCGIGGGDFYMAKKFGVCVDGIDLSSNMIEIAMEKVKDENTTKVQFEIGDITKREYGNESFDIIYSRDTLLHIKDKLELFKKFLKWLKPGGKLLISDYCCGELPHRDDFKAYVAQRGYTLYTPQKYGEILQSAGFVNVKAEDRTWQFKEMLQKELRRMTDINQDVLKDFSDAEAKIMRDGWRNKVQRVNAGDQKWGLFYAEKMT